ncbi:MAG: hypothetical protein ACM3NT_05895 [Methylocystaceae bacterium]
MKKNWVFRTLLVIISLTLIFSTVGCQKKQEAKPMKQASSQNQQAAKPPKNVKSMLQEIDKILKALDQKAQQQKLPQIKTQPAEKTASQQAKGQAASSGGNQGGSQMGSNQKGQQQGSNGQQQQGQQQQQVPAPTIPPAVNWQPEIESLKKLHQEWNALEPEAVKAGMTTEARQKFEAALDGLTAAINKKDITQSEKSAAQLYLEFGRILSYFKYPLPQDYFQVKYLVMTTIAAAFSGDWNTAAADMQNIQEPWSRLRTQADEKQKTEVDRTEHSIQDLTQAVGQKDLSLTYIKSEIVLGNLKKIEEKLSKKQESGGSQ